MGKPTGFMEYERKVPENRVPEERIADWNELRLDFSEESLRTQGARCMDCGTPFCHTGLMVAGMASGCPINNLIPNGTIWSIEGFGKRRISALERQTTSRSLPAGYALPLAKVPAHWG